MATKLPAQDLYIGKVKIFKSTGVIETAVTLANDSVTTAKILAKNVTSAKLADDIQVGSLATLTTTEKASVVKAINELDAEIGDISALTTTATTVATAINEIDADATAAVATASAASATALSAAADAAAATAAVASAVTLTSTSTLTNKTLTAPKIATTGFIADAGGDEYLKFVEATTPVTYILITSGDTGVAPKVQGAGETNTNLHLLGSGTGNVFVSDGTDPTKDLNFELGGATTNKTMTIASSQTNDRTLTLPDATDTLVGKATTDVLTNKTLTSAVLTTPQINDTTADHQYIFGVSELAADRTVTLPVLAGNDTFVFADFVQTLTNKVMTDMAQTWTLGAHDYEAGAADWTLSAAELLKPCHKPTNANAPVNAIIADTIRPYTFVNGTGQNLTVKTAAGTGITIANGKTQMVMSDGTNVIAIAAVTA